MNRLALYSFGLITLAPFASVQAVCNLCPAAEFNELRLDLGLVTADGMQSWRGSHLSWANEDVSAYLDLDYQNRDASGQYLQANINLLSEQDYGFSIATGQQSRWLLSFEHQAFQIGHEYLAATPYLRIGSQQMTLPDGWTRAASTAAMTDLEGFSQNLEMGIDHQDSLLKIGYLIDPQWRIDSTITHRQQDGLKSYGAVIGANYAAARSVILPSTVSQSTTDYLLQASYSGKQFNLSLGLLNSFFYNDADQFTWENAYSAPGNVDLAQAGLPPDNSYHQLRIQGGYQYSSATQISFSSAYGMYRQDQTFSAYTVNERINQAALPSHSLDGKILNWTNDLRLSHQFTPEWSLVFTAHHDEQDNQTPQNSYQYVIADTVQSQVIRENLPYGFSNRKLQARMAYRPNRDQRLQLGVDQQWKEQTYQEVDELDIQTLWGKYSWQPANSLNLDFYLAAVQQNAADTQAVEAIQPAENPLLSRFNLANQDRLDYRFNADWVLSEYFDLGAQLQYSTTDYAETQIGLTGSDSQSVFVDLGYFSGKHFYASLFAGFDKEQTDQSGSAAYATADWSVEIDEAVLTAGFNLRWENLGGKLNHELEYQYSDGTADITEKTTAGVISAYPRIQSSLERISYAVDYPVTDQLTVIAKFWYEVFDETNWAYDDVENDTVTNVLALGNELNDQQAVAALLGVSYRF